MYVKKYVEYDSYHGYAKKYVKAGIKCPVNHKNLLMGYFESSAS